MKDVKNVEIDSTWKDDSETGEISISYTYLGLDVKFCGRIIYITNEHNIYTRDEEFTLYSRINTNKQYIETDIDTFLDKSMKHFDIIRVILKKYKLKTIIYRTYYKYLY
tara:strand:+ start:126 stop:452 length:327 start_codon:yes stop_codon:yes gene_type:complete